MIIAHDRLRQFVSDIFAAAGCGPAEHERIAHYLVEANLVGHDSHGVIRVPAYIEWLRAGKVLANQTLDDRVRERCDGRGRRPIRLRPGDGRAGDEARASTRPDARAWPWWRCGTRAIWAGSATGPRWRPQRARSRSTSSTRAAAASWSPPSAEPSAGFRPTRSPRASRSQNGPPIIVDISTCTIAEGKIKVAFNKGATVPDGCILDGEGQPTNDPRAFYASPPGAILPMGGHKGYSLSVIAEVLAGRTDRRRRAATSASTALPTTC